MNETLRQKRAKPRLSLTYSYVCAECEAIEEAPADLKCSQCGQPMYSLSRLYRFGAQKIQENLEASIAAQKKEAPKGGDIPSAPQGDHTTAFLTEFRTA